MNDLEQERKRRGGGISVLGTGSVSVEPDVAILTVGISWQSNDVASARETVATKATAARDHLLTAGVDHADLQTAHVSVHAVRHHDGPGRRTSAPEFHVSTAITAVFRQDFSQAQAALDGLFDVVGDALELRGLRFDRVDRSVERNEARALAFADAEEKARHLAELAGAKLGMVRGIRETETGNGPEPRMARRSMLAAESSIPMEAGSLTESVHLHVRWSIDHRD